MTMTNAAVKPGSSALDWSGAIWAGIISGAVFMMLEMILVYMFLGMSPWAPPRMISGIVLGQDVLPMPNGPAPTFDAGVMTAAMAVHFMLSIIYAIILGWILQRWSTVNPVLAGAVFGLALYLINFYGFTGLFPWFAMARNWVSIVTHVIFGVVAALVYVRFADRRRQLAAV
jgi:uncharacterized membrane protein YagU involved in acid resistance